MMPFGRSFRNKETPAVTAPSRAAVPKENGDTDIAAADVVNILDDATKQPSLPEQAVSARELSVAERLSDSVIGISGSIRNKMNNVIGLPAPSAESLVINRVDAENRTIH